MSWLLLKSCTLECTCLTLKVYGSNSITYLHWASMFEWFVVECGLLRHPKDMYLEEIWLCVQNVFTMNVDTIANMTGRVGNLCDQLRRNNTFTSIIATIFRWTQNFTRIMADADYKSACLRATYFQCHQRHIYPRRESPLDLAQN